MRKRLSYLLVVAVFVSMLSLSGCGGGGGTTKSEANPYEGKDIMRVTLCCRQRL